MGHDPHLGSRPPWSTDFVPGRLSLISPRVSHRWVVTPLGVATPTVRRVGFPSSGKVSSGFFRGSQWVGHERGGEVNEKKMVFLIANVGKSGFR